MSTIHIPTDPRLAPFLPLLHIVWSDGELTNEEAELLRVAVQHHPELDAACRAELDRWLDPNSPPEPAELAALRERLRVAVARLPKAKRPSLTSVGAELAGGKPHRETMATLKELEAVLGLDGRETLRDLVVEPAKEMPAPAAPFDVGALRRLLDGDRAQARDQVRAVLSRPEFRIEVGLSTPEHRRRVFEWLDLLAKEGLGALPYPRAYGGADDFRAFSATVETLGLHDQSLVVKFGVQFGLFTGSIAVLGTERHHTRWLGPAMRLELPGCFAMSELGHGSNVRDLRTEARYDRTTGEFVIHTPDDDARKEWIGNAAQHGRMATVFAQLRIDDAEHGVHAFLVPLRDEWGRALPGVRLEDDGHKLGLNGVDNGRIWFDRVRVPRENLLNRYGDVAADGTYSSPIASSGARFFTMLGTLVGGRITVASFALSAAKSGLATAVQYGARRRQFGPPGAPERPILDYQTHQRRLMPLLATTYACHFALRALNERFARQEAQEQRQIEVLAAGIKSYVTWHVTSALQTARECCGAQGFIAANRIGPLKSDTDIYTTFEGDNTVLMQLVAKGLLTDFREQFSAVRLRGLLRYVTRRASHRIARTNPFVSRATDEEHLRDPDFQRAALHEREQRLLGSASQRLKRRLDEGMDSFEALIECQDHLMRLSNAHVERVVASEFRAAVEAAPKGLRGVLRDLCDLYVLGALEHDAGWFQSAGLMEGGKAKAVRDLVLQLCSTVRPAALGLVDAWGVPESCLGEIAVRP